MQKQDKIEDRTAVLLAQHEVIVDLILENKQLKKNQADYGRCAEDVANYHAKVVELQEELDNMQDQRDLALKVIARLEKEQAASGKETKENHEGYGGKLGCPACRRERDKAQEEVKYLIRKLKKWSKYLTMDQIFNIEDQLEKEAK
jgi:hypothetical protein